MKKFILKTVSVLLTVMLMISIIPVDCIKNGATAILDFSVKTKAADANDFSATFTNGLKYMDGNTANSFIGFIYNVRTDRVSDDMRSMGDIYRYLTGGFTKGTDEYEYAQFCFLITSEYFINKQISTQSSYASQATNNLITFLQKKVGSDESGAQQLVNSELGKVKGYIKKVLYYAFDMENDEIIQNIDMVLSSYNNVTSLVDKVKKLIESVYVTINTYYLITATNTLKAYNYYTTYLSYRDLGTEQGILELIMDVYNIGSVSFVDSVPVFLEKLGFGKSWTSADVQRILRVFAEFSFHSREEFAAYSSTGNINSIHRHSSSFYREEDYVAIFMCESCGEEFYYDKCEYEIKDDYLEVISVNAVLQYCNYIKLRASTSGKINFKGVADGAFGYKRKDVLKNIKTIYIPEGYTTLGKEAFIGCTNLKNIYLPSTIKFFGENALPNSIDIYYGGTVNQWMNLNLERSVTNWYNLYVNNKLVESISIDKNPKNYIFSGCSSIKEINIHDGVSKIGKESFNIYSGECKVTIPHSVVNVYYDSFGCMRWCYYEGSEEEFYKLNVIGSNSKEENIAWFYNGISLYCNGEKSPFEVSYDSMDKGWTCYVNSDQETVTVPHRLGNITIKTYYGCSANIKNIVLCEGIENIRRIGTFDDSKASCIETITIPKSIKEINVDEILEGKVQLKKVNYCGTVEDFYSLKNIYYQWSGDIPAFDALSYVLYCNGEKCPFEVSYDSMDKGWTCYVNSDQETVTVPHKLGDIMIKTYRGSYPNVKNLFLTEGVEKIRNIVPPYHPAGREYKLNTISVPQSVNTFGEEAFEGCQEIKMTNYLGEAGNWSKISFLGKESNPTYYSKNLWVNNILLTKLFISRDVKNINSYAYINCKSLKEVSLEEGITSIGEMAFYGSGVNKILIPRSVNFIENEAIPKDAIVYCYSDSTAYRYATENEIKYVLIDTIVSSANNKMVINNNDNYICGMQGDDFIKDVTVKEGYFVEYINQKDFLRTGATVKVYDNEEFLINVYQTVLFGDVNGDGWYDGQDAVIVDLIRNGMLTRDQIGNAAYAAADCNHNMHVDYYDVECLKKAGILLSKVNQSISRKELLETSAEYNEYLNLIDQSVAVEEKTQETEMPDSSPSNSGLNEKILMFAEYFINLILELFSKIF